MMGVVEEAGKVGTAAMGAMASTTPLAIALLLVNVGLPRLRRLCARRGRGRGQDP